MVNDPTAANEAVLKLLQRYQPIEITFFAAITVLLSERIRDSTDPAATAKDLRQKLTTAIDGIAVSDTTQSQSTIAQVLDAAVAQAGTMMSAAEHMAGQQGR